MLRVCVCVCVPAWVLLHRHTLNRARITDASVQQVCKALHQVRFHNTAVTAKTVSALELMMCRDVLGHIPGGERGREGEERMT